MSCTQRIITSPLSGREVISKTWNDIRALVQTEEEADVLYQNLTSPQFISWFGDWVNSPETASKVVNEHGEPLVVYHGSGSKFSTFDKALRGSVTGISEMGTFDAENAFFFTSKSTIAFSYSLLGRKQEIMYFHKMLGDVLGLNYSTRNAKGAYEELRKERPEFAAYVDGLKERGFTQPQIREELTRIYKQYDSASDLTGGGNIANPHTFYTDLAASIDSLIAEKQKILSGTYQSTARFGTVRIIGEGYDTLLIDSDGKIYGRVPGSEGLEQRDITSLSGEEFDKLVRLAQKSLKSGREKIDADLKRGKFTPNIYPVFLNMRDPKVFDAKGKAFVSQMPGYEDMGGAGIEISSAMQDALKEGNDGMIIYQVKDPELADSYAAFEPNQIKSVFNTGEFSEQDNIYMSPQVSAYEEILDEVHSEFFADRPTFVRVSNDTIQIARGQKALSNTQAMKIAQKKAKQIFEQTEGRVSAYVYQKDSSSPIQIRIGVTQKAVDERVQENDDDLLFSPSQNFVPPPIGTFENALEHREDLLKQLQDKLLLITNKMRKSKDETEKIKLSRIRTQIKDRIEGNEDKGIKGLIDEIEELRKTPTAGAVAASMERDLERLAKLSQSTEPTDIQEARKLADFIIAAGTFASGRFNPFFTEDDMFFDTGELKLLTDAIQPFKDWADRAQNELSKIDRRDIESLGATYNGHSRAVKLWGNKTKDELFSVRTGLSDINRIDKWVMDPTMSIFKSNGIIPQVMSSLYEDAWERKTAWARTVEERMNKLQPPAEKKMRELGYSLTSTGIGLRGINWGALFMQKTKDGYETGLLTSRYSNDFYQARGRMQDEWAKLFETVKAIPDEGIRRRILAGVYQQRKLWYLKNTMMLDISKIPEVLSDPELAEFNQHFNVNDSQQYKQDLINSIGQEAYDSEVAKQIKEIKKYRIQEKAHIQGILESEGISDFDSLPDSHKEGIDLWIKNNSPFYGVEDFYSKKGIPVGNTTTHSNMGFNITIPHKNKVNVTESNGIYSVAETNESTGYWDTKYQEIIKHPELKNFYDLLAEAFKTIRDNMPPDIYNKMNASSVPALKRGLLEILSSPETPWTVRLADSGKFLYDKLISGFGIVKEGDVAQANINYNTGRPNYEVNASFLRGNTTKISQRTLVEKGRFIGIFNANRPLNLRLANIGRGTVIDLKQLDPIKDEAVLIALGEYMHSEPNVNALLQRNGGNLVPISRVIKQSVIHDVVRQQSFDLPRVAKYFSGVAMEYAARQEVLPILSSMKAHYEQIRQPEETNVGAPKRTRVRYNKDGSVTQSKPVLSDKKREKANVQMEDWFHRVILNNYGMKDFLVSKKKFYLQEEKEMLSKIDEAMATEKSPAKLAELQNIRDSLGLSPSLGAAFNNFLKFTRFRSLAYNLLGATTNFMDGFRENLSLADTGIYFKPKTIYTAYAIVLRNFLFYVPNIGGALKGQLKYRTDDAIKVKTLMNRYRVLQDSSNELQKSSVKTNFSWTRNLSPFELIRRIEFINQSPLMVAMLLDTNITGKDGKTSSVFDAMDRYGNLIPNFDTEENRKNWVENQGQAYTDMKSKLGQAITEAHGNYSDKRGMLAKSSIGGRAMMMFKSWLPNAIRNRYGMTQDNLAAGVEDFKGRYWSQTPYTAALAGALGLFTPFGITGLAVGGAAGYLTALFAGSRIDYGYGAVINPLMDIAYNTLMLAKKAVGIPVNVASALLTNRVLIDTGQDYNKYIGKGKFTAIDAKNMRSNITSMTMMLTFISMSLLIKSLFWDDDDDSEEGKARREQHNLWTNRFMSLLSNITTLYSPAEMYNQTVGQQGFVRFYQELEKTVKAFERWSQDDDILEGGAHRGESRLGRQLQRMLLPGMLRDGFSLTLGTEAQRERQIVPTAYDKWFHGEEKQAQDALKQMRAKAILEFKEENPEATEREQNKYLKRRGLAPKKKRQTYVEKLKQAEAAEED